MADGEDVRDLIPGDPQIRFFWLQGKRTIGQKRNWGCERAAGQLIAHWDDDDFSAPTRLEDQVGRLQASGKSVTGYRSMRFFDGSGWWQYDGAPEYALGTSLVYTKAWWEKHKFPSEMIGEDNAFVAAARASSALVVADAGNHMYATIHPANTSPRQTKSKQWRRLS